MAGEAIKFEGNTKPTAIEQYVLNTELGALNYTEVPTNLQMRVAYDTDGTQKYLGWNNRGVSEDAVTWLIHYLEYDSSKRIIKRTIGYGSWTLRSSVSFS